MNKDINQMISQFLDDELDQTELDSLLTEIKKKPELKHKINRYQVMTQALKVDQGIGVSAGFLDKINEQIRQEPHYLLPKKAVRKRSVSFWQKTSLAVAASITCVAVIISQQGGIQVNNQAHQMAAIDTKILEKPAVQYVESSRKLTQHERLKAYLQAHNDELYTHGSLSIQPLVRTASYGRN